MHRYSMEKVPRVGVGIFVRKDGKFLMLKRMGSHGEGSYFIPGGHLEFNESPEECAIREVYEETGVKIKNVKFAGLTNDIFDKEGKHYITLFMESEWHEGEPMIVEPEKCPEVMWVTPDKLPSPLFLPLKNYLDGKKV